MKLDRRLKDDTEWQRFCRIVELASKMDVAPFLKELKTMHKSRTLRAIGLEEAPPTGKKLAKAALVDQAYRSRIVEIVMSLLTSKNLLNRSIHGIKKHLQVTYAELVKDDGYTTARAQDAVFATRLDFATSISEEIESAVEMCDLVLKDIDQGGFAIKHSVEALVVATKREFNV